MTLSRTRSQSLTRLIEQRMDVAWDEFAQQHPHLAAAIRQTQLTQITAQRLADDPQFQRAMEQAAIDEMDLQRAQKVMELIDGWVRRMLVLA